MCNGGLQGFVQFDEMSAIENVCPGFCGSVIGGHLFNTSSQNICQERSRAVYQRSWVRFPAAGHSSLAFSCTPPLDKSSQMK